MGEVVAFPSAKSPIVAQPDHDAERQRPPATVFEEVGWRILEFPHAGQFIALSTYCRRGVEVGRFDPRVDADNHHAGTEVAILTSGADERLSRCAIGWLNTDGPETAILGSFIVSYGGRYHFWRDAVLETAAIGGLRLVRLLDGSIAVAIEPEPVTLLDPFALLPDHRRRKPFESLPGEIKAAILRWADPRDELGDRLYPPPITPH